MSNNIILQNEEKLNIPVSYSKSIQSKTVEPAYLQNILRQIQTGDGIADVIKQIRSTPDKKERHALKEQNLPVFSMAQYVDNRRKNSNLKSIQHLVFDFDNLAEGLNEIRQKIENNPSSFTVFLSPSGNGLKLITRLDGTVTDYKQYTAIYLHYAELLYKKYGVKYDPTKDAARMCYLSFDPEIYVNPEAIALPVEIPIQKKNRKKIKDEIIANVSSGAEVGTRTHAACQQLGVYIQHNVPREFALAQLQAWNKQNPEPLPDDKLEYTVNDVYDRYSLDKKLENYWSLGKKILEIGIVNSQFYMEENPKEKVYVRVGVTGDAEKQKVYKHLVTTKHIPHLNRVNHLGDMDAVRSYYDYDKDLAEINVHHAAIPSDIQDNQFIENYLRQTFGPHTEFIKEWLAVYCYTNYRKLPFLVLTGDRGRGKNTFAEAVGKIFQSLSTPWHGREQNFNPEVEQKLLIADETISQDKEQYKTLKKYSGQDELQVNHKYLRPYKVPNNINVIILSNARTPIFVEPYEYPSSEMNNQFFVYEFPALNGSIDPQFKIKLQQRLGHYIRTELKQVYDKLDLSGKRYSVSTPITKKELALFENNLSEEQILADEIEEQIRELYLDGRNKDYIRRVNRRCISHTMLNGIEENHRIGKINVARVLADRGIFVSHKPVRKMILNTRDSWYCLTKEYVLQLHTSAIDKKKKNCHHMPVQSGSLVAVK